MTDENGNFFGALGSRRVVLCVIMLSRGLPRSRVASGYRRLADRLSAVMAAKQASNDRRLPVWHKKFLLNGKNVIQFEQELGPWSELKLFEPSHSIGIDDIGGVPMR
jgi:hypothetical protein